MSQFLFQSLVPRTTSFSAPATVGASAKFASTLNSRVGVSVASPTNDVYIKFVPAGSAAPTLTTSDYEWIVGGGDTPNIIAVQAGYDVYLITPAGASTINVTEWVL